MKKNQTGLLIIGVISINDKKNFMFICWVIDRPFWVSGTQPLTLYGGSVLTLWGIPSMETEDMLFSMGIIWDPTYVCKYCICIRKENWNIRLVISVIVNDFWKCKERVHNMMIGIYSVKSGNLFFWQVCTQHTIE